MDIGLIVILILLNGIFAMSEMSLVSSGKARLQKLVDEHRAGAKSALKLHQEPSRFLSTIQVGITLVAILNGVLGEDAIANPIYQHLQKFPLLAPHADVLAQVSTVILITYLTVVIGELVPKRLALLRPEGIAVIVARPMNILAIIASPLVWLLSSSSNLLLRLMRAHRRPQTTVTNEEIKLLMEIGSETGVFHASEGTLVTNILRLDEQRVGAIMTPRKDIYAIDLAEIDGDELTKIADCPYSKAVICQNGLENVLGILHRSDLLKIVMSGAEFDIISALRPALYIPDSMTLVHLLEFFRKNHADFALIVNEYGETEGLVSLSDVLAAIVGDLPTVESELDPDVVQREDGSWLVDGGLSIKRLKSVIGMNTYFPGETDNEYNTVSGFILFQLEKIPQVADHFVYLDWHFEVMDIDGIRIDKVLIIPMTNNDKGKQRS
ncbi:MAG: hemolysin family protein [Methylomonas sp.]|jgi:putative hemolysin